MKISDYLARNGRGLLICAPEESIENVARLLSTHNIGALPVCRLDRRLIGILSERDIVRGFAREGARLGALHVRELMTSEVITCAPDDDMAAAEKLMNTHGIRHLPVVIGDLVAGMLSIRDTLACRLDESRYEADVLRDALVAARYR